MTNAWTIDPTRPWGPGAPFPPLHRGCCEVDPVATGISPPPPELVRALRDCGIDLVRVGVGVWLPGHEPDDPAILDREWFRGSSLAGTEDAFLHHWEHLDAVLVSVRELGCEAILSID